MKQVLIIIHYFVDGIVVIAGDLFEKEEDLQDDNVWKEAGN